MNVIRMCEGCAGEVATTAVWCCFRYLCTSCAGVGHGCELCRPTPAEVVTPAPRLRSMA